MSAVESQRASDGDAPIDPQDIVVALRFAALTLQPEEIGLDAHNTPTSIWGLVIETAYPDAVASLVVLADGSVSLYVSNGSGCVGCGTHNDVRIEGTHLLSIATNSLELATPSGDFGYPPPHHVRFYFLTIGGPRSAQVRLEQLNAVDAQLSALYFAAQRVINTIERVGAGQSIEQEIRIARSATLSTPTTGSPSCLSVGNVVRRLLP
jgi:hypothetical protein